MTAPEFSRTVRVDTLGQVPRSLAVEADEAERAALAKRFGFVELTRLSADVDLSRREERVAARGTLRAALTQSCVATGEPVPEEVEEAFAIEFRPHPQGAGGEEEIELGEGEMDVVFFDGAMVDIGEAVAETLSLAVDPYPRSLEAGQALRAAGVKSEDEAAADSSPFAVLKGKTGP